MNPIEPTKITQFERTDAELELFWIFCICVAGKNSDTTASVVNRLFRNLAPDETPFDYLKLFKGSLHNILVAHRVGQYGRIERAILGSLDLNLRTCTLADLLGIHGVGNKTARFFLLHSRRDTNHCVLDIHILRYLRNRWGLDAPMNTPQNNAEYARLEALAARLIKSDYPGLSLADADLLIWSQSSGRLADPAIAPHPPGITHGQAAEMVRRHTGISI